MEKYEQLAKIDKTRYLRLWKEHSVRGAKIPDGSVVVPTEWAYQNGVADRFDQRKYTKVGNVQTRDYSIKILREGNKQPNSYWSGFWRLP